VPLQKRLWNYLQGGRIHPAMVFSGPERIAKMKVAKNVARFLLCPSPEGFCGQCSVCRRIDKELHPDVLILREDGEDTLKIDSVRELCHQMEVSPVEGTAKVCLIDECHRMNAAAANAFLKSLEEPGAGRYFLLLTTQVGSLLPTILSRCLQFHFKPEKEDMTRAGTYQPFRLLFNEFSRTGNPAPLLSAIEDKAQCLVFLQFLQEALRGAALEPHLHAAAETVFPDSSDSALLRAYDEALKLEGRLRSNANYALMLESYLRRCFIEPARVE
jgi:DNA polymerase III delta' subunit